MLGDTTETNRKRRTSEVILDGNVGFKTRRTRKKMPKRRPSTEYAHHEKPMPVPGQPLTPDETQPVRTGDHRQFHDTTRCLARYSDVNSTATDRFDFAAEEVRHEKKIPNCQGEMYLDRSSLPETDQIVNDSEDCFEDGIEDVDILRLMCSTPVSVRGNEEHSPYRSDYHFVSSEPAVPVKGTAQKFISPVTTLTQIRTNESIDAEKRTPIVRVAFPNQVRNRSPVIGLSPARVLRTCFRIGEAINAGRDAVKNNKEVLLELYARVVESVRVDDKQTFVFCDLFHTKPPYIKAEYPSTIWQPCNLHEVDSGRLLVGNRMCRCIGTMRKEDMEWTLQVLNIWECTWEDIEWVEAIVNA